MVAVSDFSGLDSSAWGFAGAPPMGPIDSLARCMGCLRTQDIEAHRPGFRAFGPNAMPHCLLGVFWQQGLELGLGILVFEKRRPGPAEYPRKLRPGIGRAHVDDTNGSDARPRRLGT